MRDNQQEPSFELQDWFDGGDIFYRPRDKKRFTAALDAIIDNELGVAVLGSNEAVLDHYCRMLIARMRDVENFELEVFLPVNTDSLLSRFNTMLAEISMEQATKPPAPDQPVRLLVINDARAVNEEQWGLLARLLSDFPGVNVRLVLVINKSGWPAHEKLLNSLGRRMHRWVVEVPAMDEARELLLAAQESGYTSETEALLIEAGLGGVIAGRYNLDNAEDELDPDLPQMPELDIDVLIGSENIDDPEEEAPRKNQFWPGVMIVTGTIAMSLLAISWFYPTSISDYQESLQTSVDTWPTDSATSYRIESIAVPTEEELEEKRQQAAAAAELAAVQDAQPDTVPTQNPTELAAASAESTSPSSTNDLSADDNVSTSTPQVQEEAQLALQPQPQSEPQPDSQPQPDIQSQSDSQPQPQAAPPTELLQVVAPRPQAPPAKPVSALIKAAERIASARSGEYFVQHIVLSTEAAAEDYISRYQALDKASVVPVRLTQNSAYAVISGPFSSRSAAASFTQNPGVPGDYWIRGAAQLKSILRR
ncbi:SPOR domain-containing protein [Porticoccaceae bacterium]|nr:SPOR domain-containing protein [Porticoccaceae bacterium]